MTALGQFQRVVILGKGPGAEIWQTGFSLVSTAPLNTQADVQSYANTIEPFVNTWWTACKAFSYASYSYGGISIYQYVYPSTRAAFQAQVTRTSVPGTLTGHGSPIDACCVVSLRSALPGRSGRGRMYIPCHTSVNPADGCFDPPANTTIGTATKTLFSSIASGSTGAPAVVSRKQGSWQPLTAIDTDNKPDVQRRRENKLVASSTQVLAFP